MSATLVAPPATSTRPTTRLRRTGLLVGMVAAPWTWLVTNTAYMLAIRDGGTDETGADSIALAAAHPTLLRVATVAVMLGGILVVPAVLGTFRLAPRSTLVTVGGSLMVAGYVCYAAIVASGFTTFAMAERGGPLADYAAVLDAAMADPWGVWAFLLFVAGNLGGTLLLAAGLWRSRAVPAVAAALLASWPVLHVIGLVSFGNEVPQVVGAALQAAGFALCALTLRRAVPED